MLQGFSRFLHHFVLAKLAATSIRVKHVTGIYSTQEANFPLAGVSKYLNPGVQTINQSCYSPDFGGDMQQRFKRVTYPYKPLQTVYHVNLDILSKALDMQVTLMCILTSEPGC